MAQTFEFTVEKNEIADWVKNAEPEPREVRNLLMRIGIAGENILKSFAEKIRTFGTLANSADFEVIGTQKVRAYTSQDYGDVAMEFGRKPGKMPPINAIAAWAKKKGVNANPFLIAKKIKERGTRRFINKGPRLVTEAGEEFSKAADKEFQNFLDNRNV